LNFIPPTPIQANPTTPDFYFLGGSYDSAKFTVPFFSCNLKFEDASKYLSLAEEVPGMNDIGTNIQELYQRQINWKKVSDGLTPYVISDQIKFMNAITVVLVPKISLGLPFAADFQVAQEFTPPDVAAGTQSSVVVGPITLGFYGPALNQQGNLDPSLPGAQLGAMAWNPDQVHAIAIDGQHRLAAIKKAVSANGANQAQSLKTSRVPVLFILLDHKAGYRNPESSEISSLNVVRRIFTDLNKHAVKPSRARLILLDDQSPQAECVRALIGTAIANDASSLDDEMPRLPLSLVDWVTEQAKFDSGPFVTTVLGIDWFISEALNLKEVKSGIDFDDIRTNLSRLKTGLGVEIASELQMLNYLQEKQHPFNYEKKTLEAIRRNFQVIYAKSVIELLTQFSPYKRLLSLRKNNGSLAHDWQQWFNLKLKAEFSKEPEDIANLNNFEEQLVRQNPSMGGTSLQNVRNEINSLKSSNELAFAVVFQKAYFLAFLTSTKRTRADFTSVLVNDLGEPDFGSVKDYADSSVSSDFSDEMMNSDEGELQVEFAEDFLASQEQISLIQEEFEDFELESDEETSNEDVFSISDQTKAKAESLMFLSGNFISALNAFFQVDSPFFQPGVEFVNSSGQKQRFWKGAISKVDGTIDYTQGAALRASYLLQLIHLTYNLKSRTGKVTNYPTFDALRDEVLSEDQSVPTLVKDYRTLINNKLSNDKLPYSIGARILNELEIEYDFDKARDHILELAQEIWDNV